MSKRSWKSTASGVVILMTVVLGAIQNPHILQDPMIVAQVAMGVGLLFTADEDAVKVKTDKEIAAEVK